MLEILDFEDLQCFFSGTKHSSGTRGLGARSPQRVSAQSALAGFRQGWNIREPISATLKIGDLGSATVRSVKWGLGAKPPAPPGGREATQDALAESRGEAPGKFWSF